MGVGVALPRRGPSTFHTQNKTKQKTKQSLCTQTHKGVNTMVRFADEIFKYIFFETNLMKPDLNCTNACRSHRGTTTPAHDDVSKWKHFPRYWPFVRGIQRSPVNSPHKGQWRGALMFSFICAWSSVWVNNREAGDLRRHRVHYDAIVMFAQNRRHVMTLTHFVSDGT